MAYLKKEQYEYREKAAARRAADNEQIAVEHGMTKEQAGLISDLCALRHELHTNIQHYLCNNTEACKALYDMVERIDESGLQELDLGDYWGGDYIDIDDFEMLFETVKVPEDDNERNEWFDNEGWRISQDWENVNSIIEEYLRLIDKQYGTKWCPTGALRIM